jgi:hypothetical protein
MQALHLIEEKCTSKGNTPKSTPKQTLLEAYFTHIEPNSPGADGLRGKVKH